MTDESKDIAGDERLIHALLQGVYETPEAHQQRTERVIETIDSKPSQRRVLGHPVRWLSAAAGLVLLVTGVFLISPSDDALAGVDRVLEHWRQVDQTFVIELERERGKARGPRRGGRRPMGNRIRAAQLDGAKLYVRGDRQVLILEGRRRSKIAKGFDGQNYWHVGRQAPNIDSESTAPLTVEETLWNVSVDLWATLEELRLHYDIAEPQLITSPEDGSTMHYYVAQGRAHSKAARSRIELWAAPITGQVYKMTASGLRLRHPRHRYRLEINLVSTEPLPSHWFTEEAHRR